MTFLCDLTGRLRLFCKRSRVPATPITAHSRRRGSRRLREIKAVNRHRNPKERRGFTRQFPGTYRFHRGASQHAGSTPLFRRQTKRQLQRRANLERNLCVELNARPRNVAQLSVMEFRRLPLRHADLHGQVNVVAHGLSILFHGSAMKAVARRWPTAASVSTDNKAVKSRAILQLPKRPGKSLPLEESTCAEAAAIPAPPHSIGFPANCW